MTHGEIRAYVTGARQREEVFARMAAVVASTMGRATVSMPTPDQAHADPRVHLVAEARENDVDEQLEEADRLQEQREHAADEEWSDVDGQDAEDLSWDEGVM